MPGSVVHTQEFVNSLRRRAPGGRPGAAGLRADAFAGRLLRPRWQALFAARQGWLHALALRAQMPARNIPSLWLPLYGRRPLWQPVSQTFSVPDMPRFFSPVPEREFQSTPIETQTTYLWRSLPSERVFLSSHYSPAAARPVPPPVVPAEVRPLPLPEKIFVRYGIPVPIFGVVNPTLAGEKTSPRAAARPALRTFASAVQPGAATQKLASVIAEKTAPLLRRSADSAPERAGAEFVFPLAYPAVPMASWLGAAPDAPERVPQEVLPAEIRPFLMPTAVDSVPPPTAPFLPWQAMRESLTAPLRAAPPALWPDVPRIYPPRRPAVSPSVPGTPEARKEVSVSAPPEARALFAPALRTAALAARLVQRMAELAPAALAAVQIVVAAPALARPAARPGVNVPVFASARPAVPRPEIGFIPDTRLRLLSAFPERPPSPIVRIARESAPPSNSETARAIATEALPRLYHALLPLRVGPDAPAPRPVPRLAEEGALPVRPFRRAFASLLQENEVPAPFSALEADLPKAARTSPIYPAFFAPLPSVRVRATNVTYARARQIVSPNAMGTDAPGERPAPRLLADMPRLTSRLLRSILTETGEAQTPRLSWSSVPRGLMQSEKRPAAFPNFAHMEDAGLAAYSPGRLPVIPRPRHVIDAPASVPEAMFTAARVAERAAMFPRLVSRRDMAARAMETPERPAALVRTGFVPLTQRPRAEPGPSEAPAELGRTARVGEVLAHVIQAQLIAPMRDWLQETLRSFALISLEEPSPEEQIGDVLPDAPRYMPGRARNTEPEATETAFMPTPRMRVMGVDWQAVLAERLPALVAVRLGLSAQIGEWLQELTLPPAAQSLLAGEPGRRLMRPERTDAAAAPLYLPGARAESGAVPRLPGLLSSARAKGQTAGFEAISVAEPGAHTSSLAVSGALPRLRAVVQGFAVPGAPWNRRAQTGMLSLPVRSPFMAEEFLPRVASAAALMRAVPQRLSPALPTAPDAPARPAPVSAMAEQRPPMPLPSLTAPMTAVPHDGLLLQRARTGESGVAPADAAAGQAQQDTNLSSGEKGAAANDVHLMANEVWSLLKRRMDTEAERMGRR